MAVNLRQVLPGILVTKEMAHLGEVRLAGDRIPVVRCRVHRQAAVAIEAHHQVAAIAVVLPVVDLTGEAIQEADRAEVPLTMDILHPDMTTVTDRFSPRFTSHLTHRQEASDGASCPPRHVGLGKQFRQDLLLRTVKLSDLGVESI